MPEVLTQLRLPFDVPPAPERTSRSRHVRIGADVFRYSLTRARRRTIALLVERTGIEVRAPRHATIAEIESFIREKEPWIRKRLAEPRVRPFIWESGAILPWLGGTLTVALRADASGIASNGRQLEIGLAEAHPRGLRERAVAWIQEQALALFRERAVVMSGPLGLGPAKVGLSNALTQWGSCGEDGRVLLNWRLMMLPRRLIDYVVAHELAHRRELNHSERFWAIVESLYPGHAEARRELRRLAGSLPEL
jgi:predicted metal-dependent hydrolase